MSDTSPRAIPGYLLPSRTTAKIWYKDFQDEKYDFVSEVYNLFGAYADGLLMTKSDWDKLQEADNG